MNSNKLVNIEDAIKGLKMGETLLYPTDTVWGIGCDAMNEKAVNKIHEIKGRPKEKSFILLVDGIVMLEKYLRTIPEICYDLIETAEKPLTIIYDSPVSLPEFILAEDGTIGIRVTKDLNCRKLIQSMSRPLVSTSANLSGFPAPRNFSGIQEEIKSNIDLILNLRLEEEMQQPSSILKIGKDSSVKVIR